jgi:hypothetical protein
LFVQVPLQQSAGLMHAAPFGRHGSQPQNWAASSTQMESHITWQQNGSKSQMTPAHALHAGLSGPPSSHWP